MRRGLLVTLGLAAALVAGAATLWRCSGALGVRRLGGGVLPVAEVLVGGAEVGGEPLPLVVALHGRGDAHERFASVFSRLRTPARIVSIGAPVVERDGRAWFTFERGRPGVEDDLDACVPRILETLAQARASRPVAGRPVLVGFSQGALLTYLLALREPRAFAAVFPVSGFSVGPLAPPALEPAAVPPIHAFHGTADEIIALDDGRQTVEDVRALGVRIDLTTVPGATHWIGTEMSAALLPAMDEALAAQRP